MSKHLTPTVKCEVCYNRYKALSGHLKKHGYSVKKYREEFKDAPVVSVLTLRKMKLARLKYIFKKTGKRHKDLSRVGTGRPHSEATKEKIRQIRLGTKLSEAHKMAISAGLMGHKVSEETRLKLSQVEFTDEHRRKISEAQCAGKGNAWKGGKSRHLYQGKDKYRLKRIFGEPLKCFFPGCHIVEGENVRSIDCHHIDGDHENNPLDGMNWLPLCRRHHMLADGRLKGTTAEETKDAFDKAAKAHADYMSDNYQGEIKTYFD